MKKRNETVKSETKQDSSMIFASKANSSQERLLQRSPTVAKSRRLALVSFCPGLTCPHYSTATRYPRKCYYQPQCWRGYLDILIRLLPLVRAAWR